MADRYELVVAIDPEHERHHRRRSPALTLGPSADDALHRAERLDLHPRRRARRRVRRVEPLRDDALETLLLHRFEQRHATPDELLGPADRAHRRQHLIEDLLALAKRPL